MALDSVGKKKRIHFVYPSFITLLVNMHHTYILKHTHTHMYFGEIAVQGQTQQCPGSELASLQQAAQLDLYLVCYETPLQPSSARAKSLQTELLLYPCSLLYVEDLFSGKEMCCTFSGNASGSKKRLWGVGVVGKICAFFCLLSVLKQEI